jgi:hypothetical protein
MMRLSQKGRYRRYATKTQGHKALIFRFYFLCVPACLPVRDLVAKYYF